MQKAKVPMPFVRPGEEQKTQKVFKAERLSV